jgi:TRAP-type C4-dicarboxylate transport system permease small subunit
LLPLLQTLTVTNNSSTTLEGPEDNSFLTRARRVFESALETFVLFLVGSLAMIVIAGVAFRKFGMPLVWYDEVASIMLAWLTYYGACLAGLRRAHIGFPGFVDSVSPEMRRVLIILRELVVIGFFALAAWAGWRVVLAVDGFYLASLPNVSRQITHSVIPIGAVLFIIAELLSVRDLIRGESVSTYEEPITEPIK